MSYTVEGECVGILLDKYKVLISDYLVLFYYSYKLLRYTIVLVDSLQSGASSEWGDWVDCNKEQCNDIACLVSSVVCYAVGSGWLSWVLDSCYGSKKLKNLTTSVIKRYIGSRFV